MLWIHIKAIIIIRFTYPSDRRQDFALWVTGQREDLVPAFVFLARACSAVAAPPWGP